MSKDPLNSSKSSLFPNQDLEPEDDDSWQVSYLDIITILLGFLVILLSFSTLKDLETFSVSDLFTTENQSEFITTPVDEIIKELEALLAPEIAAGQLSIYRELNDAKIEFKSDDLYASGSATLQNTSKTILNRVLAAFKLIKYNDFEIDVEGHTDNVPIRNSSYASNWELSTARASNVVKYFSSMGIADNRLKASGYADSRPVVEFDPQGNPFPAEKSKNRRIVLRLYYSSPNQFIANSSIVDSVSSVEEVPTQETTTLKKDSIKESPLLAENTPAILEPEDETQAILPPEVPEKEISPSTPETASTNKELEPLEEEIIIPRNSTSNNADENGCKYTIQTNQYESFANALRALSNAEKSTGLSFDIVYNNHLFSVRSTPISSLKEAIQIYNRLPSSIRSNDDVGIINQCYSQPHQFPDVLTYIVQLGFFQNEQNAVNFQSNLSKESNINANIEQLSVQAYNVFSGPFKTKVEAQQLMNRLRSNTILSDAFIKYSPSSISDYRYNYQILAGSFESKTRAFQIVESIQSNYGYTADVITKQDGRSYIIITNINSQEQALNISDRLKSSSLNLSPILYLNEES